MDDAYEQPDAAPVKPVEGEDDDGQSSGEEDEGPDWTKYASLLNRPTIPKRGEKDFEPKPGGGSGLQVHVLDRARSAMLDALRGERITSSKGISFGIWYPTLARVHATVARGSHFNSMGHSAPRPTIDAEGNYKIHKRMELLPEEAIYLIERGTMFIWKGSQISLPNDDENLEDIAGPPMSVQQAFAEMIGREDLTLERYQVFAYLKRLGYTVTRTNPPSEAYPKPPALILHVARTTPTSSILQRIRNIFSGTFNWWKPLNFSRWFSYDKPYAHLFKSLRFLPAGHDVPLRSTEKEQEKLKDSPYKLFYDLYKPVTQFRKSTPPRPDYSIVVINARTTPMPSLYELSALYDDMAETPLPPPRQRRILPNGKNSPAVGVLSPLAASNTAQKQAVNVSAAPFLQRLFPWFYPRSIPTGPPPRRINPFMALKAGKKIVIVAVVDAGSIGFFRFGQGVFTEWPMM